MKSKRIYNIESEDVTTGEMAILRFLYRKRHILFMCVIASTFWLFYLFLSLPSNANEIRRKVQGGRIKGAFDKIKVPTSPSRTYFTLKVISRDNKKNVLEPPVNRLPDSNKLKGDKSNDAKKTESKDENKNVKNITVLKNETDSVHKKAAMKIIEMGQRLKNKTLEVGQNIKNKTLEKLSALGVIKSQKMVKMIYLPSKWNLNLSLEDVGNIMKDTQFLHQKAEIGVNYPRLLSNNTNANTTVKNLTMSNAVGFCDCDGYECMCCARLLNKRMHFGAIACSNITFVTKSQEFDFRYTLDKQLLNKSMISAEKPPVVCIESLNKVAHLCTSFLNVTSKVSVLEEDKLHVWGCLEFSITLYNKTVSAFPVDCFKIPSHQHHQKNQLKVIQDFGNWMP